MTHNAWANAWETAVRTAVSDETTLLAGHNDLAAGGITHLALTPGKATAMATARHSSEEAHTVITLPVLTDDQMATVYASSAHCRHHRELRAGGLPDCLADPAHTGNVPVAPAAAEIAFACTCGTSPCRHAAALTHAVTHRLSTHPAEFAIIRGLSAHLTGPEALARLTRLITGMTNPYVASGGKAHVTAHQAWGWYQECAEPPPTPDEAPGFPDNIAPTAPAWPSPPPPAPHADQLHALLNDAAAQARNHLLAGTALQCAWDDDAVRLTSAVPRARILEIAERLGIDIAQLRERLSSQVASENTASP